MGQTIQGLLEAADIRINGDRPWDLQVHNPKLFTRLLAGGSLAFGESYMDGWWDSEALDEMTTKLLAAQIEKKIKGWRMFLWHFLKAKLTFWQSKSRAFEVGRRHYDIGNDLYEHMLDKRMNYSCGYWKEAKNLDDAQEAKLELICRKIGLMPGQRVLDIGCGWGAFARYAAENYGAAVVGITVSEQQVKLAQQRCKGLTVEIRLQDYRDLQEKFDHVISVGMFEHVGFKNYRTFMRVVDRCLKPEGIFLLHTIGSNVTNRGPEPWSNKYIFPNSILPSVNQISEGYEGIFVMEDWHNFGTHYDRTLMAWYRNFTATWDEIKSNYDERFYRMWTYFLLTSAGSSRVRKSQLWQIVFSKMGVRESYQSVR